MAGKKGSRSSKTDHVLNLLSGGAKKEDTPAALEREKTVQAETDSMQKSREEQQPVPEKASEPAEGSLTRRSGERLAPPILQVARTNNEALAQTIRDALTQTLEEELAQRGEKDGASESGSEPEPEEAVPELEAASEPGETPAQNVETETNAAPTAEECPVPRGEVETVRPPKQSEQEEAEEPEKKKDREVDGEPSEPFLPRETRLPDSAVCVNVMELLVDERLDRYVRMFGLCTCPRCLADVRALSLTRLPPKYVVMPGAYATPMISLYRAKFESQVIAQVIQACKIVMEHPRHIQ